MVPYLWPFSLSLFICGFPFLTLGWKDNPAITSLMFWFVTFYGTESCLCLVCKLVCNLCFHNVFTQFLLKSLIVTIQLEWIRIWTGYYQSLFLATTLQYLGSWYSVTQFINTAKVKEMVGLGFPQRQIGLQSYSFNKLDLITPGQTYSPAVLTSWALYRSLHS